AVLGPAALGSGLMIGHRSAEPTPAAACDTTRLARYLADRPPLTLLASPNDGPELLWRTPHRVVSLLSYRATRGLIDWYDALASDDDDQAERILRRRQVDLVVLCPKIESGMLKAGPGKTALYHRLIEGRGPEWLRPEVLPPELSGFRLFRFKD